jgi:VCBS repeat-containing protein
LYGGLGDDSLDGGTEDDLLFGNDGNDTVLGGDGADELHGGAGDDSLEGGTEKDLLFGEDGNDTVLGGDGDDELQGNEGNDSLDAGAGDDSLFGQNGNDQLLGNAGIDKLYGGLGDDSLDGGTENDLLFGNDGNDTVLGGDGNDELQGNEGNDSLDAGTGDDLLFGHNGNDQLLGNAGADELHGGAGDDSLEGGTEDDWLFAEEGDDSLNGGTGDDTLIGGSGNDHYRFGIGSGFDIVYDTDGQYDEVLLENGLSLNDITLERSGNSVIVNIKNTSDSLALYDYFLSGQQIEALHFADGTLFDATAIDQAVSYNTAPTAVDDNIVISEDNSGSILGNVLSNDNDLNTGDTLMLVGQVFFSGSYGNLTFNRDGLFVYNPPNYNYLAAGETVTNTFDYVVTDYSSYSSATLSITIEGSNDAPIVSQPIPAQSKQSGQNFAFAIPNGTFTDADQNDVLTLSTQLSNGQPLPSWLSFDPLNNTLAGTPQTSEAGLWQIQVTATDNYGALTSSVFDLTISNTPSGQIILGTTARDILSGGAGNDTLIGGLGDDRYNVDSPLDVVIEKAGEGTDSVKASSDYTLPDQVENLELEGPFWKYPLAAALNGTGNDLNNDLIGNGSHNYLQGLDGNDTIDGGTGNDTIDGGKGNDDIYGGYDDFYFEEDEQGNMVAKTDWGNAIAGYGSAGEITIAVFGFNDDIINGQEGDDTINGGPGSDMLYGGSGNDLLCGGENSIYTNFTILTNDNTLDGGEGNDILVGGTGDDRFIFGLGYGSDTIHYYMDYGTTDYDEVWLTDGITLKDITFSYDNYDLIVGLKNTTDQLRLVDWDGSFIKALHFSDGSVFDTTLIEQMINNTPPIVSQPIAAQSKQSGQNFTFAIPNGTFTDADQNDVLTLSAQLSDEQPLPSWLSFDPLNNTLAGTPQTSEAGVWQIQVTATDSYGASINSVFDLTIASSNPPSPTQGQTILGTSADDTLSGGAGNDSIKGGDGNDSLIAGLGNDFLNGSTGFDSVDYSYTTSNLNITLNSSGWATVNIGVDDVDTLAAIENLTGGAGNDTFIGNSQANVLKGNGGDDVLNGWKGKDVLSGGQGADKFVFEILHNGDLNKDIISDFNSAEGDKIQLPKNVFTAFSSLNAVANINLLIGSAALDTDDFLIYDPVTGMLSYDADGVGSVNVNIAPLELAMLGVDSHPATLAASDFILV